MPSWLHYAITYWSAGDIMSLYVDGVLALNQTINIEYILETPNAASPNNYRVGYSQTASNPGLTYFHGYLDDLAVFRGVLSIGQIRHAMSGNWNSFQGYGKHSVAWSMGVCWHYVLMRE